ncbi:MAG: preprotein translocase subunit SecG [Spirochaetota bacterium]
MSIVITLITIVFVIVCILLILLILMQSDKSSGAGLLGGSSQSTFGSSTADVVTKITGVLVALFLVSALSLAAISTYSKSSAKEELLSTEDGGDSASESESTSE